MMIIKTAGVILWVFVVSNCVLQQQPIRVGRCRAADMINSLMIFPHRNTRLLVNLEQDGQRVTIYYCRGTMKYVATLGTINQPILTHHSLDD